MGSGGLHCSFLVVVFLLGALVVDDPKKEVFLRSGVPCCSRVFSRFLKSTVWRGSSIPWKRMGKGSVN